MSSTEQGPLVHASGNYPIPSILLRTLTSVLNLPSAHSRFIMALYVTVFGNKPTFNNFWNTPTADSVSPASDSPLNIAAYVWTLGWQPPLFMPLASWIASSTRPSSRSAVIRTTQVYTASWISFCHFSKQVRCFVPLTFLAQPIN